MPTLKPPNSGSCMNTLMSRTVKSNWPEVNTHTSHTPTTEQVRNLNGIQRVWIGTAKSCLILATSTITTLFKDSHGVVKIGISLKPLEKTMEPRTPIFCFSTIGWNHSQSCQFSCHSIWIRRTSQHHLSDPLISTLMLLHSRTD